MLVFKSTMVTTRKGKCQRVDEDGSNIWVLLITPLPNRGPWIVVEFVIIMSAFFF